MPSHLFIEDRTSLNVSQRAQVYCKGEKLLGGPVNDTYEDGVLFLECNSTTKSWTPSKTVWPKEENCITSNKFCLASNLPALPGKYFSSSEPNEWIFFVIAIKLCLSITICFSRLLSRSCT